MSRSELEVVTAVEPVIVDVSTAKAIDSDFLVLRFETERLVCEPPLQGLSQEGIAIALSPSRASDLAKLLESSVKDLAVRLGRRMADQGNAPGM